MAKKNKQVAENTQEEPQVLEQVEESADGGDAPLALAEKEPKQSVFDKIEEEQAENKVDVRCPDCPWKPGLKDEYTVCSTCEGSGTVKADPLE